MFEFKHVISNEQFEAARMVLHQEHFPQFGWDNYERVYQRKSLYCAYRMANWPHELALQEVLKAPDSVLRPFVFDGSVYGSEYGDSIPVFPKVVIKEIWGDRGWNAWWATITGPLTVLETVKATISPEESGRWGLQHIAASELVELASRVAIYDPHGHVEFLKEQAHGSDDKPDGGPICPSG
jgi:hypothetical protein